VRLDVVCRDRGERFRRSPQWQQLERFGRYSQKPGLSKKPGF